MGILLGSIHTVRTERRLNLLGVLVWAVSSMLVEGESALPLRRLRPSILYSPRGPSWPLVLFSQSSNGGHSTEPIRTRSPWTVCSTLSGLQRRPGLPTNEGPHVWCSLASFLIRGSTNPASVTKVDCPLSAWSLRRLHAGRMLHLF